MSAWVERMGPMYHEGAYFDDAVTVSFSTLFINLFLSSTDFIRGSNLVLKFNLICLDPCGWLQRFTTYWNPWVLPSG